MNSKMEMMVMEIMNTLEEQFYSKEAKNKIIFVAVAKSLLDFVLQGKISSTDYADALDILERMKSNSNQ